jgi:hypothetical protein
MPPRKTKAPATKPAKTTATKSNSEQLRDVEANLARLANRRNALEAEGATLATQRESATLAGTDASSLRKRAAELALEADDLARAATTLEAEAEPLRRQAETDARRAEHEALDKLESDAARALSAVDRYVSQLALALVPLAAVVAACDSQRQALGYGVADRLSNAVLGSLVRHGLVRSNDVTRSLEAIQSLDPVERKAAVERAQRQRKAAEEAEERRLHDPARVIDELERVELPTLRARVRRFRTASDRRQPIDRIRESLAVIQGLTSKLTDPDKREAIEAQVEDALTIRGERITGLAA